MNWTFDQWKKCIVGAFASAQAQYRWTLLHEPRRGVKSWRCDLARLGGKCEALESQIYSLNLPFPTAEEIQESYDLYDRLRAAADAANRKD